MTDQNQQLAAQAQRLSQQLQAVMLQKEALNLQSLEMERALKEMENSKEEHVYKISGPILIKADKTAVTEELKEKKAFIDLKLKTLEKNELTVKEKIDELRTRLTGKEKTDN